jgi:hypothetical protein
MLEEAHHLGKLQHIRTIADVTAYDITKLDASISLEEANAIWESYGKKTPEPHHIKHEKDARAWVDHLLHHGKLLSVITARSDDGTWKRPRTMKWIAHHFPEIQTVHFVNHFSKEARPKSLVCGKYHITLMIDDSIENAIDLCEAWVSTILLEKPWNRDVDFEHPLLYRAKDWWAIIDSLKA